MRRSKQQDDDPELKARANAAPVLIVGMGSIGRAIADALRELGLDYDAVERDQRQLAQAVADGYRAAYGDTGDPRLWEPVALHGRRLIVPDGTEFSPCRAISRRWRSNATPSSSGWRCSTIERMPSASRDIGMIPVVDGGSSRGAPRRDGGAE